MLAPITRVRVGLDGSIDHGEVREGCLGELLVQGALRVAPRHMERADGLPVARAAAQDAHVGAERTFCRLDHIDE